VLFSDLVGSTELSQSLDPEDYAELVLAYQERGRQIVTGYGGMIASYLGDGLLAQFGYPIAHEDDADRAIQAGLQLCRSVKLVADELEVNSTLPLQVRVAVHAGITVVGRMGDDERSDLSLFGDTANIASRVQSLAGANELLITEDVAALLRHDFDLSDRGAPELKGVLRSLRLYAVQGPSARQGAASTQLIDRTEPLRRLRRRWNQARAGSGGGVVVLGPAGVGKSRLVAALASDVPTEHWLEVRGSELASDSAFSVLLQLVERALELPPLAQSGGRVDRLIEFVAAHRVPTVSIDPLAALIAGEPMSSTQSSESAFHAVVELALLVVLDRVADLGHAVVVIDDFHWVDPSSQALISHLLQAAWTRPLLLVLVARPEGFDLDDDPPFNLADAVVLDPLLPADVRQLVVEVATLELGDALTEAIISRAEGIPLFAEELTRGAEDRLGNELPPTLQASLLARLDRTPELRDVAQMASTVGTRVPWDVLSTATGKDLAATRSALDRLVASGVLVPEGRLKAHAFRHALVRDAVYSSMVRSDRRRAHRSVADALERLGPSTERPAEVLAHHLAEGGDGIAAARQFAAAALVAARNGACEECRTLCERGLELLSSSANRSAVEPIELQLTMTLGNAVNAVDGYGATGQLERWERAEELCQSTGNERERSSAMNGQAITAMFRGDSRRAVAEARRIIALGESNGDRIALLRGHSTLALESVFLGDVATARTSAETAISLYVEDDYFDVTYGFGTDHGVIVRTTASVAATLAGKRSKSLVHSGEGIALARRLDSPISLCLALTMTGMNRILFYEARLSRPFLDEAEEVAEVYGFGFYRDLARLMRAGAAALDGDPGSQSQAERAVADLLGADNRFGSSVALWLLALAQEAAGNQAQAGGTAEGALQMNQSSGEHALDAELVRMAVRTGLALGSIGPDDAALRLAAATTEAARRGIYLLALRAQGDVLELLPEDEVAMAHFAELQSQVE